MDAIFNPMNTGEFRANLLSYLEKAHDGEELVVTSNGKILATIQPPTDKREKAKKVLNTLSKTVVIGDIVSPNEADWKAAK